MSAEGTPHTEPSLLARPLGWLTRVVIRFPAPTIALAVAVALVALALSCTRLGFRTSRLDLISSKCSYNRLWIDYIYEFGDEDDVVIVVEGASREQVVPSAELLDRIGKRWPLTSVEENYRGEVATRYRFDDGGGEIGFISSVTDPFCGDCTRARLSANGELYTCLFAGKGADLRGMMRNGASDQDLEAHIADLWGQRSNRYSEQRAGIEHPLRKVEMYQVGG